jgi:hypothetical protein
MDERCSSKKRSPGNARSERPTPKREPCDQRPTVRAIPFSRAWYLATFDSERVERGLVVARMTTKSSPRVDAREQIPSRTSSLRMTSSYVCVVARRSAFIAHRRGSRW